MLRFEHDIFLWALILIPVFILVHLFILRWEKKASSRFAENHLMKQLIPNKSTAKRRWKFILFLLAFFFLIIGIANPQIGTKMEEIKREGVDVMVALDVSNSMKAEDIKPNRLAKAKRSIQQLVEQLHGDRVGLIVFAGKAYVQLPITTDYSAARLFLDLINTDVVPIQGTNIAAAIQLGTEAFDYKEGGSKVMIIISDGENHEPEALEAAEAARKKGIKIYTVGMGTPDGAPIPLYRNGRQTGFKQDDQGNTIITSLNEDMMMELAQIGNGEYFRANNSGNAIRLIMDQVQEMQKAEFETNMYTDYEDRFQYFIALSLLLYLVYFLIGERRSNWVDRLNLFGK